MAKVSRSVYAFEVIKGNRLYAPNAAFGGFYDVHSIMMNDNAGTITFGLDDYTPKTITVEIGDKVVIK